MTVYNTSISRFLKKTLTSHFSRRRFVLVTLHDYRSPPGHQWIGRDNLDLNAGFWKQYPSGDDVAKSWKELQGQN